MATQTGSTYIAESTTYIINISTGYSTYASSEKVFLADFSNDRQPEMAVETGNTYISETMSDIIETPTATRV